MVVNGLGKVVESRSHGDCVRAEEGGVGSEVWRREYLQAGDSCRYLIGAGKMRSRMDRFGEIVVEIETGWSEQRSVGRQAY